MGTVQQDANLYCDDCGAVVKTDRADGTGAPCPACGSTHQQVRIVVEDKAETHDDLHIAARRGQPGEIAPHFEYRTWDSWSTRLRTWMRRTLRFDHEQDDYEETITDPTTGEVVHHQREPLSKHRGHGRDRRL